MKKHLPKLIMAICFLCGLVICFYPIISDYLNRRNSSYAIENLEKALRELSPEVLDAAYEQSVRYNDGLRESHFVLTDPFDPSASSKLQGDYEQMLALTDAMAAINIPAIGVNLPIYHGTSEEVLSRAVGHLVNTSLPVGGAGTHAVLSAHTGLPSAMLFTNLSELRRGDHFTISVLGRTLTYSVDKISVIEPDNTEDLVIDPAQDYVTLITCTPYGVNSHRLVVRGVRVEGDAASSGNGTVFLGDEQFNLKRWLARHGLTMNEFIVYSAVSLFVLVLLVIFIVRKIRKIRRARRARE